MKKNLKSTSSFLFPNTYLQGTDTMETTDWLKEACIDKNFIYLFVYLFIYLNMMKVPISIRK